MRETQIVGWIAAILGILGEGLLVWFLESLPTWAQWLVYGPFCVIMVVGLGLLVVQARRDRARRAAAPSGARRERPTRRSRRPPPPPPRSAGA
ncbi:MAG: hypothetical protein R3B09_27615 [Nannocystaceae bacterium]